MSGLFSRRPIVTLAGLASALLVAGCGGGQSQPARPGGTAASPQATGTTTKLTVSAAASLVTAFGQLQEKFETANPGVDVVLNYGGSSGLAQQIVTGAPVDVFAAANTATMDTVAKAGLVAGTPRIFVTNKLEIAVAPGNPKGIAGFKDLARPDLKVVICARQVPCGSSEKVVEAATGVTVKPVSEESDVTSVLSKVGSGDADAGVVYVTDVRAAGSKVTGIEIPASVNASTEYPIAALSSASNAAGAQAFVAFVVSDAGRAVLSADGFEQP